MSIEIEDMALKPIDLGDTPQWSPWPERLLGVSSDGVPKKSPRTYIDNMREYDGDKWSLFLKKLTQNPDASVGDLEALVEGDTKSVGCLGDALLGGLNSDLAGVYYAEIANCVLSHWTGESVIEIGAGYGGFTFRFLPRLLGHLSGDSSFSYVALEPSRTGRKCLQNLGAVYTPFAVADGNLEESEFTQYPLPTNGLVVTTMSLVCLSTMPKFLLTALSRLRPQKVCFIEPLLPEKDLTLLQIMRRSYLSFNNYNSDVGSWLTHHEKSGSINVRKIHRDVVGNNFLLPASVAIFELAPESQPSFC